MIDVLHRQSIRLKKYDYSQSGWYFLTICSFERECLFGEIIENKVILNKFGYDVEEVWKSIVHQYQNVELDKYVIMPNHIHGIIIIRKSNNSVGAIHELPLQHIKLRRRMLLPKIVGYFKMRSAKNINIIRSRQGMPVWQRNYYEHIIRNEQDYFRIKQYIIDNPKNWESDEENPNKN